MISKQIFKGNKPAKLMCRDCEDQQTCPESPQNLENAFEQVRGPYCCFAVDTGNEDSGSVLIQYETGMHVVYSQNFFARKQAAARGARFFGYKGTVEFDWYTNEIKIIMHHSPRIEIHKLDIPRENHSGGDQVLARNFINMMKKSEESIAPMQSGLLSALICLKAKESAMAGTFKDIAWPVDTPVSC